MAPAPFENECLSEIELLGFRLGGYSISLNLRLCFKLLGGGIIVLTHQHKRSEERSRIPVIFRVRIIRILFVDSNTDFCDEAAALAKQQLPEVLEGRQPIEQLRLFDILHNYDELLVVPAGKF